jgi:hypothetical protein
VSYEEFLEKLAALNRTWYLYWGERVRSKDETNGLNVCPITAVADRHDVDYAECLDRLGLDQDLAFRIAVSADGSEEYPEIRADLMRVCKLVEVRDV